MKKTLLLALVLFIGTAACNSKKANGGESDGNAATSATTDIKNKTYWTNGAVFFQANVQGNTVLMEGGTCHEGGYEFALKRTGTGEYNVILHPNADPNFDYLPVRAGRGDKVKVKTIAGTDCIIFYNSKNQPSEVLKRFDGDLAKQMEKDMQADLEGRYNHPNGQQFTFAGNKCSLGTDKPLKPYTFLRVYETPSYNFRTADGELLMYVPSIEGIDLFEAIVDPDDEDEIEQGGELGQLEKVIGDADNGRWPFTAEQVVTLGQLSPYNQSLLRMMRNEIYARHGWHFSSQDLRDHFSSQWWYKDRNDNASIKLSELEQLNVAIIKAMEESLEE